MPIASILMQLVSIRAEPPSQASHLAVGQSQGALVDHNRLPTRLWALTHGHVQRGLNWWEFSKQRLVWARNLPNRIAWGFELFFSLFCIFYNFVARGTYWPASGCPVSSLLEFQLGLSFIGPFDHWTHPADIHISFFILDLMFAHNIVFLEIVECLEFWNLWNETMTSPASRTTWRSFLHRKREQFLKPLPQWRGGLMWFLGRGIACNVQLVPLRPQK